MSRESVQPGYENQNPDSGVTVQDMAELTGRSEQMIRLIIRELKIQHCGYGKFGVKLYFTSDEAKVEHRVKNPKKRGPIKVWKTYQVVGLVWQCAAMKGRVLDKPQLHRELDAKAEEAGIPYARTEDRADGRVYRCYVAEALDQILALYGLERTK